MKMSIIKFECKNIRRINSLCIPFVNNGKLVQNTFIMMANGTGKTTILNLIKGLLSESALHWEPDEIKSYAPTKHPESTTTGEFSITVKFNEVQYKYFLELDYTKGIAKIETLAPPKGRENGLRLPEAIKGIFTPEFVSRFVFDGEQAKLTLDSKSNEADETIRYLYRLDELDQILAMNSNILTEVQNAEGGSKGTDGSLRNLRTRQTTIKKQITQLEENQRTLKAEINQYEIEKEQKERLRKELDRNFTALNNEKTDIITEQEKNRGNIDVKIAEIVSMIKMPWLVNESISTRMFALGAAMKKLKLPKSSSKDFFTELANAETCICGRTIGEKERATILRNAEHYLGSDHQGVLNNIKNTLGDSIFDDRLSQAFNELSTLQEQKTRLDTKYAVIEEKLIKAGGPQVEHLQGEIDDLIRKISAADTKLKIIESRDENDTTLTEENNLHKARRAYSEYESKIAATTKTNAALRKKNIVEGLINKIKVQATKALKQEIIKKTNQKINKVITDDFIEIESIDSYIKLNGRNGASEGQTLSIGYCFLGTLFEDSELEFPFVIDSPTGKMDFDKRQAVADVIPLVFNQLIAFVQPAEVECFADRFYENANSQYFTIVADSSTAGVTLNTGIDFFDSYQRSHKGENK